MESKIDEVWEKLFDEYKILEKIEKHDFFSISAKEIKAKRVEPRIMTKFDSKDVLPKIFKKNHLTILPNSRGSYLIGKFDAYKDLEYKEIKPAIVHFPTWIKTFPSFQVSSEAVALNVAQMTGMIDLVLNSDGLEEGRAVSTITGRLGSGKFQYRINLHCKPRKIFEFKVNNSQVEIDGGFENLNKLAVIEAKNILPNSFIIRQLYYPYRIYQNLGSNKEIIPIFFTHVDDIYTFYIYNFSEPMNYSSIYLVKQMSFIIDENLNINIDAVKEISNSSPNKDDNDSTPFPQADNFTRILDILQRIKKPKTKEELGDEYDFDPRQGDYYGNALVYLGFAKKESSKYKLTALGEKVANLPNSNIRNKTIIEQILSNKCFNEAFKESIKCKNLDLYVIQKVMRNIFDSKYSGETIKRRSRTVKSWLSWIINIATSED